MTHTPTLPRDDRGMWRRLVSRSHPDAGGDDELFLWTVATRDAICGDERGEEMPKRKRREQPSRRREVPTSSTGERLPFDKDASLEVLTDRAVAMAEAVAEPFGYLLRQAAVEACDSAATNSIGGWSPGKEWATPRAARKHQVKGSDGLPERDA